MYKLVLLTTQPACNRRLKGNLSTKSAGILSVDGKLVTDKIKIVLRTEKTTASLFHWLLHLLKKNLNQQIYSRFYISRHSLIDLTHIQV